VQANKSQHKVGRQKRQEIGPVTAVHEKTKTSVPQGGKKQVLKGWGKRKRNHELSGERWGNKACKKKELQYLDEKGGAFSKTSAVSQREI